jgi:hypothetical protein
MSSLGSTWDQVEINFPVGPLSGYEYTIDDVFQWPVSCEWEFSSLQGKVSSQALRFFWFAKESRSHDTGQYPVQN